MNEDIAIKVENVSKDFILPHKKRNSIKSIFLSPFSRYRIEKQHALDDISFEIKKGEFFGIVGRNGSGKSTLLKCMAGVYVPTKGSITINGSLVPFIELGVGFDPELSGRDNVYLNGALLGFSRTEIDKMYQEIVDFAELEKFMDQKLKNYSSGMQVRLAFSVAIQAKSDILLLDEVLAVGDSAFQQKCTDYFASIKKQNKTIVLVSHNMQAVERFCDRAMLINDSKIHSIGNSSKIAEMYENIFLHEEVEKLNKQRKRAKNKKPNEPIEIHSVKIVQDKKTGKNIDANKEFEIQVYLSSKYDIGKANFGINIKNQDRVMIISSDTEANFGYIDLPKGKKKKVIFKIKNIFTNGLYTISVGLADYSLEEPKIIFREEGVQEFIIHGSKANPRALVSAEVDIRHEENI